MAQPLVTFVTVYHNECERLPRLLKSVIQITNHEQSGLFEFLFIDNGSIDGSSEIIDQWVKRQNLLPQVSVKRKDNHLANARQQAIELTNTQWVVFVDADAELLPGWVDGVLKGIEKCEPSTAVIGGGERYPIERQWHHFASDLAAYFPIGKQSKRKTKVDHVPTNNYLVKRDVVIEVGGFDPFYKRVGEDLDLNIRINEKFDIFYFPDFEVNHYLSQGSYSWFYKMALYGRAQSYVYIKYGGGVPIEKFLPILLVFALWVSIFLNPQVVLGFFVAFLLIPRTRFFLLTFLFYGMGEVVGIFQRVFTARGRRRSAKLLKSKGNPAHNQLQRDS